MPAAGMSAKPPSSPDHAELWPAPDHAELSPAPDRREPPFPWALPSAWADQDAELDAEIAALEAAGLLTAPAEEEQPGLALDPDGIPPHAWLADLSGSAFDEYLAAAADAAVPAMPWTERRDRAGTGAGGFGAGGARAGGFAAGGAGAGGFGAGGAADLLSPGAALAGLAEDAHAAGLSRLTDDELSGLIRAGRRLSSWASALELTAVGDLMRRREQQEAAGHLHAAEHADAEIAALLTLTGRGAGRVLDLAISLRRLPLTARALAAGVIDLPRVAVIADETTGLGDDHAAAVEQRILVRAPGQTTSQVRAAARRAALTADPDAARKRREQARREARVERWDEHAGTAALAGRDLPPASVFAADQHISALARALRAAGLAGTADQLRAQAFLALLSGTPTSSLLPTGQQQPDSSAGGSGTSPEPGMSGQPYSAGSPCMADSPVTAGGPGSAAVLTSATADWPGIPPVAGTVNLTMPLSTWLGMSDAPGEVSGFGPLAADDSRHLGAAMAGHPHTRWCVTLTGRDGGPVAHGCARPACGPPGPPPGACVPPLPGPAPPLPGPAPPKQGPSPPKQGPSPPERRPGPLGQTPADWLASIPMKWFESAGCTHQRQSAAYRPPQTLQHLIRVRQQTCAFPGCRRPASQCDLDHTTPFQRGGLTCECNLAPLCRRHHEAKQAPGWWLEQSCPGVLTWTIPSGRTYTTRPAVYPG
jgi:Domain of unknown function (DUF222)